MRGGWHARQCLAAWQPAGDSRHGVGWQTGAQPGPAWPGTAWSCCRCCCRCACTSRHTHTSVQYTPAHREHLPAVFAAAATPAAISSLEAHMPATPSPRAIMHAPVRVAMSTIASDKGHKRGGKARQRCRGGWGRVRLFGVGWAGASSSCEMRARAARVRSTPAGGPSRLTDRQTAPRAPATLHTAAASSPTPHWFCANSMASARVSRPSASVLLISTVLPAARDTGGGGGGGGGEPGGVWKAPCSCW